MIKINVDSSGMLRVKAKLEGQQKQVKFATVVALNKAAYSASNATKSEIGRVFQNPTDWVKGGVRYKKARKDKLEASVDFDAWGNKQGVTVAHVLNSEIHGGSRKLKRHEIALQRAGILPPGTWIVPGPAATLDRFGNMSAGQIIQIMAWFRAFGEQGYQANMTDKNRARLGRDKRRSGKRGVRYFVLYKKHGKLIPGIYQSIETAWGGAAKPVMYFVKSVKYRQRLDFYGVAERAARAEFSREFPIALEKAWATEK